MRRLLRRSPLVRSRPFSLLPQFLTPVPFRYIGFTVGKGQLAGPVILESVSFAPSGSVMTMSTLIILCAFAFLMSFLQGEQMLTRRARIARTRCA